jgi:hypothetical protein
MEQGVILQQLAARFGLRRSLVTPATAIAGARGAQPAKVWQLRGVGLLLAPRCGSSSRRTQLEA